MALIGKIRNNSWILIVLIGLGMLGFLIMDMTSSNQGGPTIDDDMGMIAGEPVSRREFDEKSNLNAFQRYGDQYTQRQLLWDYFVEDRLIDEEAEELGLSVPRDEELTLLYGPLFSPVIQQEFTDPTTRRFNRDQVAQVRQLLQSGQLNPSFKEEWIHIQDRVINDRLTSKLNTLIRKSIYTPTWMVEQLNKEQSATVDFTYLRVPFDAADATDVEVSDSEIEEYIEENRARYYSKEPTRVLQYVKFSVAPTSEDSSKIRREFVDNDISRFRRATDDAQFTANNNGQMRNVYLLEDQLPEQLQDTIFDMQNGDIFGPYLNGTVYTAAKRIDVQVVPDSVKARHILIGADPANPLSFQAAEATADSLMEVLEGGADFAEVARNNSTDQGSASEGGDLGYFGLNRMVEPFENAAFYDAEVGEPIKVQSQFGVHIILVEDRKFDSGRRGAKVAFINKPIVPSQGTMDAVFNRAQQFRSNNSTIEELENAAASDPNLETVEVTSLTPNSYLLTGLPPNQSSRDAIKWAFKSRTDVGFVSPDIYDFNNQQYGYTAEYIVVGLVEKNEAGLPAAKTLRKDVEGIVRNRKIGKMIAEKIEGQDINAIRSTYPEATMDTVRSASFSQAFIAGIGNEPKVLAAAFALQPNATSKAILGSNGVYKVTPIFKPEAPAVQDIAQQRRAFSSQVSNRTNSRSIISALKEKADIEDNRARFY